MTHRRLYSTTLARMQTNAQIEPPIFAVLRRAEQNAAAAMPAWLENLNRTEEMLKRAQNLRPRRRRKQSANMPIDRQLPEQPSMTPQREDMPPVVPSQTDIEPPKRKRGPGRLPGETFNSMEEVRDTLLRLTRDNRKIPSQRLVAQNLPLLVSVDAVQDYAAYWFGGWRGVKRMCAEYLRKVEAEQASAGRDN